MKKPKIDDCLVIEPGNALVVEELFVACSIRWVRAVDKRGDSRYFSELEWARLKQKHERSTL